MELKCLYFKTKELIVGILGFIALGFSDEKCRKFEKIQFK